MKRKPLTLRDLGKQLGLSVTTVSKALRGGIDLSPKTRDRILAAAEQAGYIPNALARDLRTQKTKFIGTLITDSSNPYYAKLTKGIQVVLNSRGYRLVLLNSDENAGLEIDAIRLLQEIRVAGALITPVSFTETDLSSLGRSGVPYFLINRYVDEPKNNWVVGDDEYGGHTATRFLIDKGYRRIAFINGPLDISPARDRFEGFKRALEESGIPYCEELTVHGYKDAETAHVAIEGLLGKEPLPDAIFCFSDYVAAGVMAGILEAGLRIPDDIAIVGYDDIEFAPFMRVPLTTMGNPCFEMGSTAATLLLDSIEGRESHSLNQIRLKPKLVVRDST